MAEVANLGSTRRRFLLIVSGTMVAVLANRRSSAQSSGDTTAKSAGDVEVFRGPAKVVGLELSDREGGYVPIKSVRSNTATGGQAIAWHFESPLRNGEAELEQATLTASDDGRLIFTATAHSRAADDHWNVFFGVRSKKKPSQSLFVLPAQPKKQPLSPDGVPLFEWLQFPTPMKPLTIVYEFPRFDPKLFGDLGDVLLACDC